MILSILFSILTFEKVSLDPIATVPEYKVRCFSNKRKVFSGTGRNDIKMWFGKKGLNGFSFFNVKTKKKNTVYANTCHFNYEGILI